MKWGPITDTQHFWIMSPITIPVLIISAPVLIPTLTAAFVMSWVLSRIFPPLPWRVWFAWHPVKLSTNDSWIWLEKVNKRRQSFCHTLYGPLRADDLV